MKIALIGNGAMGQLVAKLAKEQGHEIGVTLDSLDADRLKEDVGTEVGECDVAIDFSVAAAVPKNIELCMLANVPLVEGTTGWQVNRTLSPSLTYIVGPGNLPFTVTIGFAWHSLLTFVT